MIILTVGTQLPFDRLVRVVDEACGALGLNIVAQIGEATYMPRNLEWRRFIDPIEFEEMASEARLIVGHAGVGTVLMAQRHLKPVLLFPRRADMGEHRNDHQMATASALEGRQGVYVARDNAELVRYLGSDLQSPVSPVAREDRDRLRSAVTAFIRDGTL